MREGHRLPVALCMGVAALFMALTAGFLMGPSSQQAIGAQASQSAASPATSASAQASQPAASSASSSSSIAEPLPTQKSDITDEDLLPAYTYSLSSVAVVGGRQGVATDGEYYWVSGSKTLIKYDKDWNIIAQNDDPFEGYDIEVNHIGDIDVYNNEVYVGAEYFEDGVGKNIQIAVYDGDTLKLKRTFPFNSESGQEECAGITVNPDDGVVVMCSWVGEESGRYLYEYDLKTGAYLRKVHLQCPPQWIQGVFYCDGAYYMTADDGTADLGEPDHIYRTVIDPDKTYATVTLEKTLDDVAFQGEIEGLTVDKTTNQMLVLYNRGSRIVLGMVKGFYPGYDAEISEVYVYDRSNDKNS